jgi:hypothetical protein
MAAQAVVKEQFLMVIHIGAMTKIVAALVELLGDILVRYAVYTSFYLLSINFCC